MINTIIHFLIFPGFLFTAASGCLVSWIDRKVTARVQWRTGPPLLQPFYDLVKLSGKETIIPARGSKLLFLSMPLVSLSAVTLVSTLVWVAMLNPAGGFNGDLIVVFYLLALPAISLMLSGAASANPLASMGTSREIKLMLGYELPFILVVLIPVIKSGGELGLGGILAWQHTNGMFLGSLSGVLGFLAGILCIQAKLGLVPFDCAEAETELAGGILIEYSGTPLAVYKLSHWMMLFVLPMFFVVLYMGGILFSGLSILWGILKYVLLLVIIVVLRNTNPRVRIDQAVRFFWLPVTGLAVLAVIFAFIGI